MSSDPFVAGQGQTDRPSDPLRALDRLRIWGLTLVGARSRVLKTSVGDVHWATFAGQGVGEAVLVHGLAGCMGDFAGVLRGLRRRFASVHAVDLPGHGRSEDPQRLMASREFPTVMVEVLDAAQIGPATLLGHSMGGYICTYVAAEHPDRVERLILISPGGAATSEDVLERTRAIFTLDSLPQARAFVNRLLGPRWYGGWLARGVHRRMSRPFMRHLIGGITNDDAITPAQLGGLSMPVLLLWGEEEPMFGPEHFDYWRQHLPSHARVERPPQWGHVPLWDHRSQLVDRVVTFLDASE